MIVHGLTLLMYRARRSEDLDATAWHAKDVAETASELHTQAVTKRMHRIDSGQHVWPEASKEELHHSQMRLKRKVEHEAEIERRRKVWAMGPAPNGVPYGDSTFDLSRDW